MLNFIVGDFSRDQGNNAVEILIFCPTRPIIEETDGNLNGPAVWLGRDGVSGNDVLDISVAPTAAADPVGC